MKVAEKIVVVTGGGSGIGAAMARRFAAEGAKAVVVADLNGAHAEAVAAEIGGHARTVDVSDEAAVAALIDEVEGSLGPIDLFCSNAGIGVGRGIETPDDVWRRIMDVNLMAHVYAARHLVPRMIARGGGYLLNTASAAGLLSQIGSVTYAVSKHAAVSFAEWVSITHGDQGIGVSVLCPQAVNTPMIAGTQQGGVAGVDGVMEAETVAEAVIEGLAAERFLILPHPEVAEYLKRKAGDYDRWLGGMRRLQARYGETAVSGLGD
ncbi:MAG: SDR family NAD(P)-dependent oxidoreductase [Pseudomonadales bacterium]|jgi:NAD(P)-dependent dehydrogenase (short-subunit alcohol dehydrogenase family)|nr:SDR family NAD(P)-dependent oxidoreductase [Pseudomonadales bacterium]